jgi:hypothetical protein
MNNKSKQYKYDELSYAKLIYESGFQTKYLTTEIKLLALYLRDILNMKLSKRTEYLYEFCSNHISNYNKAKYFRLIDSAIKYSQNKKRKFVVIDRINIYKEEVDYINSLDDIDHDSKKVLFTFLVQKKLDNITYSLRNGKVSTSINFKGGKQKYNNIKIISKISNKTLINDDIINKLNLLGYINIKYAGLIELTYLNNITHSEDIAIKIINYNVIGWYFDLYNKNNKIKLCECCSELFQQKSNSQKYCSDKCAETIKDIQDKEADKRYKEKIKARK